jgi:glycosyltransferase involved in cell wall biosynthesis
MARRNGIAASKGSYLLFLDSDDYWDSNLLGTVNQTVDEYHCDMILYNFKCVSEHSEFISEYHSPLTDKAVYTKDNCGNPPGNEQARKI